MHIIICDANFERTKRSSTSFIPSKEVFAILFQSEGPTSSQNIMEQHQDGRVTAMMICNTQTLLTLFCYTDEYAAIDAVKEYSRDVL